MYDHQGSSVEKKKIDPLGHMKERTTVEQYLTREEVEENRTTTTTKATNLGDHLSVMTLSAHAFGSPKDTD